MIKKDKCLCIALDVRKRSLSIRIIDLNVNIKLVRENLYDPQQP